MGLLTGWVSPQILPFSKYLEIALCPARHIKLALRKPSKRAWHCQVLESSHCQGLERALVVGLRPLYFKRKRKKLLHSFKRCPTIKMCFELHLPECRALGATWARPSGGTCWRKNRDKA